MLYYPLRIAPKLDSCCPQVVVGATDGSIIEPVDGYRANAALIVVKGSCTDDSSSFELVK